TDGHVRAFHGEDEFLFLFADVREIFDAAVDVARRNQTLQGSRDLVSRIAIGRRAAVEVRDVPPDRLGEFIIRKPNEIFEDYGKANGGFFDFEGDRARAVGAANAIAQAPK